MGGDYRMELIQRLMEVTDMKNIIYSILIKLIILQSNEIKKNEAYIKYLEGFIDGKQ